MWDKRTLFYYYTLTRDVQIDVEACKTYCKRGLDWYLFAPRKPTPRERGRRLRTKERGVFPWLAIDDRSWLYRPFNRFLFLVDGKTGMTAANAEELIGRPHGM